MIDVPDGLLSPLTDALAWLMQLQLHTSYALLAAIVALIAIINPFPLRARDIDTTLIDLVLIVTRHACGAIAVVVGVILPGVMVLLYGFVHHRTDPAAERTALGFLVQTFADRGWLLAAGLAIGAGIRFTYQRWVAPEFSAWLRAMRQRTEVDVLSDVRAAITALQPKSFEPRRYYRDGWFFVGLDQQDRPVYEPAELIRKTNLQCVGPTRFGKGVALGCLLDQSVRCGHAVIYVDPKHDEWGPWVLKDAAQRVGRRFVVVDLLNDLGGWHPFMAGSLLDRRERIVSAFGLADTGTDADFYKGQERRILDRILAHSNGSIASLLDALEALDADGEPLKAKARRLHDGLREFALVPALNPKQKGLQVADVLRHGWVLYFAGDIDSAILRKATLVFIKEACRLAQTMAAQRDRHLTIAIDELKFLVSQELSNALATTVQTRVNMILLHQSVQDLLAPEDRTLNARAIEASVRANCQMKLLYKCDPDTARWAADMSGTALRKVARMERTEVNDVGGEVWQRERTLGDQEEALIPMNTLLTLPPRVGAFYGPHRLATVVFTSPVKVANQGTLKAGSAISADCADSIPRTVGPRSDPVLADALPGTPKLADAVDVDAGSQPPASSARTKSNPTQRKRRNRSMPSVSAPTPKDEGAAAKAGPQGKT